MPRGIYKRTKEHLEKLTQNFLKHQFTWKGKKRSPFSEKTKRKMSVKNKGKHNSPKTEFKKGIKNSNWQGGRSFNLYGFNWTDLLKHSIRTRDCFVCQICKKNGWIIHHIDYNKKNCNPDNLITLCHSCHSKTNGDRNYWKKFLTK